MRKTFIHISPFGKGYNIGNFAISLAIRKLLADRFDSPIIVSIPAHGSPDSGLNKKTIYEANNWADGIIVGGGNLFENNELIIDFNALVALQVPLVLFSNSLGRIYNKNSVLSRRTDRISDSNLKLLHSFAAISVARDLATYDSLRSLGCDNISLGGCPTIQLSNYFPPSGENQPLSRENIFLSIRNPELMNIPRHIKLHLAKKISDILLLLESKYSIRPILLCHDQRDLSFASSFLGYDYYFTSDIYDYISLIRSAKLIISMRVHSTLPCLSFGTPVVNLSYDERGLSLLKTIGYQDWDLNLVENFPELIDLIAHRLESLDDLTVLKQKNLKLWSKLVSIQSSALNVLA